MDITKDLKLLNEELNTTDLSVGLNRARFIKKIYRIVSKSEVLNFRRLYDTIVSEGARQMDKEFMKMVMSRLNKSVYQTPISVFDDYQSGNKGLLLKDGLPVDYSVSIDSKSIFAILLINNSLKDLLLLLEVIAKRIYKQ